MNYSEIIPNYADVMTVKDFLAACEFRFFIDYNGFGHPIKNGMMDGEYKLYPSQMPSKMPTDADNVAWFNR